MDYSDFIKPLQEWITEISAANIMQSYSNHIEASALYMAFNTDSGGNRLNYYV